MPIRILMVDDDIDYVEVLRQTLDLEGIATRAVHTGADALTEARSWQPDVVLLDLMLPGMDGFAVCQALRRESSAAVIMVTSLGEEVDRIVGLEVGADDYVCKPFNPRELIARIRAVLRRTRQGPADQRHLGSGNLQVDGAARRAFLDGKELELPLREFELLSALMGRSWQALSRQRLYELVWHGQPAVDSRTLDAHVRALREKIEPDPAEPTRIVTLRGLGYRFDG